METNEMFNLLVKGMRTHLRFPYKGQSPIEDLWGAPISTLKAMYKAISAEEKLLNGDDPWAKTTTDNTNTIKMQIIKFIVDTREAEDAESKQRIENKAQRDKYDALLVMKENEELLALPKEEILARRNAIS